MGVPGGTRTDCYIGVDNNPDCDADNARVLNQTASLVANFRPEPPPPPPTPEILLVNDEGYYAPEVEHYYVEALQALQVPFDTWQTGNPGQVEPNISQLSPYHIVIWFTGRNISLSTGPSQMTETVLANWLPNQNCLLISSSDYFNEFDPEHPTAFMQEVLGAASITADVSQTEVTGLGPFSSMGTLSLIEPTEYDPPDWNFTDALQPGPGAQAAFEGNKGTAGLFKLAPGYRTSYLAFPLEMLPSEQDRVMLLERYLAACRFMNIFLPAIRSD